MKVVLCQSLIRNLATLLLCTGCGLAALRLWQRQPLVILSSIKQDWHHLHQERLAPESIEKILCALAWHYGVTMDCFSLSSKGQFEQSGLYLYEVKVHFSALTEKALYQIIAHLQTKAAYRVRIHSLDLRRIRQLMPETMSHLKQGLRVPLIVLKLNLEWILYDPQKV